MNNKIISAIAFKLFAIYVMVMAIISVPSVLASFLAGRNFVGFDASLIGPVLIIVISIAVAVIVFKLLWKLGNNVLMQTSEIDTAVAARGALAGAGIDKADLEKSLFIILGLYFVITAVVDIPLVAASFWAKNATATGLSLIDFSWLVSLLVQLFIGLNLIMKLEKWLLLLRASK